MLKKTMTYTDYSGNERTEDFYFNLSKAELLEMELSESGGFEEMIRRIVASQDTAKITSVFKEIILRSVGIKSPDGKRFIKNQDIRDEFMQTEAYSDLFVELISDADKAAAFVNGIVPAELSAAAKEQIAQKANIPAPAL